MKKVFKIISLLFLAIIVYPVQAVFFIVKVVGMFLNIGASEVVDYCQGILSVVDKNELH